MTAPLQIGGTTLLTPGDPAPGFTQRSVANPRYAFDSAAGRYLVLCFYGSAIDPHAQAALRAAHDRPDIFDDDRACFFGVSVDPEDEAAGRVANRIPGYRHFWDFDLTASRRYGVADKDADPAAGPVVLARQWVVIDPTMRVVAAIPFRRDLGDIGEVIGLLDELPPPARFAGVELMAPILFLPRVFEPDLRRHLIGLGGDGGTAGAAARRLPVAWARAARSPASGGGGGARAGRGGAGSGRAGGHGDVAARSGESGHPEQLALGADRLMARDN